MQSILALVGAISLQVGANQDSGKLAEKMKKRMQIIFGDELDERLTKQRELAKVASQSMEAQNYKLLQSSDHKPMKLSYFVPRKFRPAHDEPWPCVSFQTGDYVKLEPAVTGRIDRDRLHWSISPKLSLKAGLIFDKRTGKTDGRTDRPTDSRSICYGFSLVLRLYLYVCVLNDYEQ